MITGSSPVSANIARGTQFSPSWPSPGQAPTGFTLRIELRNWQKVLPLPLREGVGGGGYAGKKLGFVRVRPPPPTPSRKGRRRIFSLIEMCKYRGVKPGDGMTREGRASSS